jgi:hypothetical protein
MANHEPNEKGIYPDWGDKDYVFKYPEVKVVNLFEMHRSAAIHWFHNGHPMKSWVTNFFETGSKKELAVLNTGPHCRHLARNASCSKATPLSVFGGRM